MAMLRVKSGRPLVNHVLRMLFLAVGVVNSSYVRVTISFLARVSFLLRRSGAKFTVIWLKAQYVNLQQAIGGLPSTDMTPLGCRVSRGGSQLPRVIPILHRVRIRAGDSDIIRFWLTLFSLYRVIEFPYTLKLTTIVSSGLNMAAWLPGASDFASVFWKVVNERFGTRWLSLARSAERGTALRALVAKPFFIARSAPSVIASLSTSPAGVIGAALSLGEHQAGQWFEVWCQLTQNTGLLNWYSATRRLWNWDRVSGLRNEIGKLGFKEEPAGKLRVFAMVDPWTQWIMKPLHDELFAILRNIPQDGTFDQLAPLERFKQWSGKPLYSLDLSAATDRLPVLLQATVLSFLLGAHGANVWMMLMVGRPYYYSVADRDYDLGGNEERGRVFYEVGQPMGARTSWAMLAITHHFIVQWCALRANVIVAGEWFEDYAVLGDDIVIGNKRVALSYLDMMRSIGVGVSPAKSLVSPRGTGLEFAKRFILGGKDLSPVPFLEYFASTLSLASAVAVAEKYRLTLGQYLGLLGFGYKARARIGASFRSMNARLRVAILCWYHPVRNGFQNLTQFLSMSSTRGGFDITSRPTLVVKLVQSLRDSLLSHIGSLDPLVAVAAKMVVVDRTRAHYGTETIDSSYPSMVAPGLRGPLSQDEMRWLAGYLERLPREMFLDAVTEIRDLRTELTNLDPSTVSLETLESTLERILLLEDNLNMIAVPRSDLTSRPAHSDEDPVVTRILKGIRPTRWAKLWEGMDSLNIKDS